MKDIPGIYLFLSVILGIAATAFISCLIYDIWKLFSRLWKKYVLNTFIRR